MDAMKLTAVYKRVPEGYVAFVQELPGTNTQGETLDEARFNLREAVGLVFQANRQIAEADLGNGEVLREPFELSVAGSTTHSSPTYDLDELVSRITPENLHDPIDCGPPIGREIE
jgi:predicted RNase H-like HicB family nuclease